MLGAQLAGALARRPPPRHRPPRPQARQRHAHARGGEAPRLRPRPARRRQPGGDRGGGRHGDPRHRGPAADPRGHAGRDVALPRSGAGAGPAGRRAQRRLRPRLRPLRGARGPARVPRRDPAEITAAILGAEPPDLREAVPGVPAALAALVRQCLAKDPDARWQCADDVARGLRLVEEGTAGSRPLPARAPRSSRWAFAVGALGLAAAAGAIGPAARAPARRRSSPCASRWPHRPGSSCRGRRWELRSRCRPTEGGSCSAAAWVASRACGSGRPRTARATGSRTRAAASRPSSRPTGGRSPSSRETTCGACRSTADRRPRSRRLPSPARGRGAAAARSSSRGPSAPPPGSTRFRPAAASPVRSRWPRPRASARASLASSPTAATTSS